VIRERSEQHLRTITEQFNRSKEYTPTVKATVPSFLVWWWIQKLLLTESLFLLFISLSTQFGNFWIYPRTLIES